ncbi:phosphotransferase family protein [Hyphomonas sp.]|uniref:phosphotransferase family protein n=1 Tax=Hyphomonas sp. TaxID=87 RepID=UPI001DCD1A64|nr:phosphotransferase family protein [Hyphomonas sp.]
MVAVRERTGLADAIAEAAQIAGFAGAEIDGLKRLSGGASKESWAFTLRQTGKPDTNMVLRRQPAEKRFTHTGIESLNVEAALLRALHGQGVPVPEMFFTLPDGSEAGEGYAMARIDGETVGVRILKSPDLAEARPKLAFRCGQILAAIHAVPRAAHPALGELPPGEALQSLHQRHRDIGQCRPVFDYALAWLDRNLPMHEPTCLVHGDFRNGNLVIGPDGVRAVLDWELAHIGAPVSDLAWLCVTSWRFQNPSLPAGGFGTREQLLAGYADGGGGHVRPESLHAWEVFQTLNWGLMCAEAGRNFMQGVRTVEGAMIARRASETEFDLLQLLQPDHEAWHA